MPAKVDKFSINNPFQDKRSKLIPCQKERIYHMYNVQGGFSQRELAKMFGVSRRTIQFIIDPDKHKDNLNRREERGGTSVYYDRDKQREYMRTHRNNKKLLKRET